MVDIQRTSVSKNVAVLFVTRVITWLSAFLLMLFLPRYLGPVDYGRFYLGQSFSMIISLLIDFGGSYSISKAVARGRDQVGTVLVDSIGIRLVLWLIVFASLACFVFVVRYPVPVKIILLIFGFSMSWSGARTVLTNCYTGFELLKYPSYGTMAETVFVSVVGVSALLLGIKAIGFSVITVMGSLIGFLICAKFRSILVSDMPAIDWKRSIALLKEGTPYFLNTLFGMIYFRIDTVMLSFMVPEVVVGWYGAAYRFFDALMFVPLILTTAVFPVMARLWGSGTDTLNRTVQKSLDYVLIVGVPISVAVFAFARVVINFFYGLRQYGESVPLLKIFAVGSLMLYVDIVIGTVLLASDNQRKLSLLAFGAVFVNIALNYFMIPLFQHKCGDGAIGSAIATLITELFVMTRMIFMLPRNIMKDVRVQKQFKALAAGLGMAISLWIMQALTPNWAIQALIAGAVFLLIVFGLRTFEDSDIAIVKNMLPARLLQSLIRS
jgi:O-antigen/teichoic acid export membrane protein